MNRHSCLSAHIGAQLRDAASALSVPFPRFLLGSSSCCSDQTLKGPFLQGRPAMGWTTLRVTQVICSSFILLPHESISKGKNTCPIKIPPRVLSPPHTLTAGLDNQGL